MPHAGGYSKSVCECVYTYVYPFLLLKQIVLKDAMACQNSQLCWFSRCYGKHPLNASAEQCTFPSSRGVQPFGVSGSHWKKQRCFGPHVKYTNINKN